jgi:hypothetical protein
MINSKAFPISLSFLIKTIQAFGLASVVGLAALPCHATQSGFQFTVKVQLASSNAGLCRSSNTINVFGEAVTVICSSGKTIGFSGDTMNLPWTEIPDGPFHYVNLLSGTSEIMGTVDSYAGSGTVTSWRVVNLADREYIELMVGW